MQWVICSLCIWHSSRELETRRCSSSQRLGLSHFCAHLYLSGVVACVQVLAPAMHREPSQRTAGAAAVRLVQEALNRGSTDNTAAVVVLVS